MVCYTVKIAVKPESISIEGQFESFPHSNCEDFLLCQERQRSS